MNNAEKINFGWSLYSIISALNYSYSDFENGQHVIINLLSYEIYILFFPNRAELIGTVFS
jgi:hypothetical protein